MVDYSKMTKSEATDALIAEWRAKKQKEVAAGKVTTFNEARELAFQELMAQHDEERQTLGALWQAKEDAGHDVDFEPSE